MAKKDVIKEFVSIKGVGQAKAELLYKNGFDSLDKLKNAKIYDLTKIKGITKKNATDIIDQLNVKKPVKKSDTDKKKDIEKPKVKEEPSKDTSAEEVEIVEEEEKIYKPKRKPKLSVEQKQKLRIRKQIKKRTPEFLREEWFRYKRIPKNWRKPDGMTSKMRKNLKYRPSMARVGFRGPKEVRGLHPSGFEEVIIHNVLELDKINPEKQAVRIGGKVGTKKRLEIAKKAEELEIRILNMKV